MGRISRAEAEMNVLGSLMLSDKTMLDNIYHIQDDDFRYRKNKIIYNAICSLYSNKINITLLSVRDELKRNGDLIKIGGVEHLLNVADSIPSTVNINRYIERIWDED